MDAVVRGYLERASSNATQRNARVSDGLYTDIRGIEVLFRRRGSTYVPSLCVFCNVAACRRPDHIIKSLD
jgi:hypothetical protein